MSITVVRKMYNNFGHCADVDLLLEPMQKVSSGLRQRPAACKSEAITALHLSQAPIAFSRLRGGGSRRRRSEADGDLRCHLHTKHLPD